MAVAAKDDTQPIALDSGRRAAFRRRQDPLEDDAVPRVGEQEHSPSAVIADAFQASKQMGERAAKGEPPTDDQIARLRLGVAVFQTIREHFDRVPADDAGRGGRGGGGWSTLVIAVAASLGITIGVPGLTAADDIAQARVLAETTAKTVETQQQRIEAVERREDERDRQTMRKLGLTVRWLGDEQDRACRNSQAIADGLNWLGRRQTRRGDEFSEIRIDCEKSRLIPPELEVLRALARDDLGQ